MSAIALLGLGRMGAPICRRLVRAGFDVTAFDPAAHGRATAEDAGAGFAPSARFAAERADILVSILPGPLESDSALAGSDGALPTMRPGSLWLDLTSGDPRLSARLANEAAVLGVASVGAPMGGGPAEAASGGLTFFVGGSEVDVERARPILAALGDPDGIHVVGPDAGAGQTAKLLANLLWFGQAAAVAEALLLGQAMGLDLETLRKTLAASAGSSRFLADSTDALFRGDYLDSFALRRCLEELETLRSLAAATATPFELSGTVTRLHEETLAEFGDIDGELLVARLLEQRAGRQLRTPAKDSD